MISTGFLIPLTVTCLWATRDSSRRCFALSAASLLTQISSLSAIPWTRAALLTVVPKKSSFWLSVTAMQGPLWMPTFRPAAPLMSLRLLNFLNESFASSAHWMASLELRKVAMTASPMVLTTVPLCFLIKSKRMVKCSRTIRNAPPSPSFS